MMDVTVYSLADEQHEFLEVDYLSFTNDETHSKPQAINDPEHGKIVYVNVAAYLAVEVEKDD